MAATQNEPANSPDASSSVDTKQTLNDSTTKPEIAKVDSAAQPAPEAVSKEEIKFSAGLFWALQLPTYSSSDYFTGPNAKAQYYRILLPGIYLRAEVDRSAFTVEANPFFTNLMPDKTYLTNSSSTNLGDTVIISKETRTMRKSFGFAAAISYDYNLRNQWWVGGGFQWQLLRDGVAKIDGEEERRATNGSGKVTRTYSETIAMTENDWQYFRKTYLGLNGHILYKSARWQTGLRVSYPITPLSKNGGPQFPLRSEVFFRLPVFKFGYK